MCGGGGSTLVTNVEPPSGDVVGPVHTRMQLV